jgi:hypothetical protein
MTTTITTMARFLEEELLARGISGLSRADCAKILRMTIDRTAEVAENAVAALPLTKHDDRR